LKALGSLAVAERDIRALSTARADSGPLSRLNCARPTLALSVRQEYRTVQQPQATHHPNRLRFSLRCDAHPSRGLSRDKTLDSARHRS